MNLFQAFQMDQQTKAHLPNRTAALRELKFEQSDETDSKALTQCQ